jgi:putative multiple sugar transport system ATP-binding protein
MEQILLEMRQITKEFPGVKALNDVNFKVKKGEIHCLVGENGAGKSTLMKILSGVYPHGTYNGDILIDGDIQIYNSISDSEKAKTAIIYQELALVPEMTLYENIFLGHELKKGMIIDWNKTIAESQIFLDKVRVKLNPSTLVKELGVGVQQLVEIAKALSKEVKLLILDEPTAALNEDDSANLMLLIQELKNQGVTCIMISHKLKEVLGIADTITILRDGKTICTLDNSSKQVTENQVIKNMVGREIDNIYPDRNIKSFGDIAFEVQNWSVTNAKSGRKLNKELNVHVKKGEIIGLAGLMGSGRTEFAHSVFGNPYHYQVNGTMLLNNEKKHFKHPKDAIQAGLAYVSEDRKGDGLILIEDIKRNISMANLSGISKSFVIDENKESDIANGYKISVGIKTPSVEQIVGNLSGGNQQKVSLSKWLFVSPTTLILDEPTRGIDVGAKYEIYTLMNKLVEEGMSIIMISSELLEIIGMSDRIYVMAEGRITGEINKADATEESIMHLATL